MTLAERTIKVQKEELQKAHNTRFTYNGMEYAIRYEGGISEYIGIYARESKNKTFHYVDGFAGYKFRTAEQVISMAKAMIVNS